MLRTVHALDVLGDPVRRRILEVIAGGEVAAGDVVAVISREFGITQPAVSQHLRVLRDTGFASVRPEGTRRLYRIVPERIDEADQWIHRVRTVWQPRLDALATEVARGKRDRRRRSS